MAPGLTECVLGAGGDPLGGDAGAGQEAAPRTSAFGPFGSGNGSRLQLGTAMPAKGGPATVAPPADESALAEPGRRDPARGGHAPGAAWSQGPCGPGVWGNGRPHAWEQQLPNAGLPSPLPQHRCEPAVPEERESRCLVPKGERLPCPKARQGLWWGGDIVNPTVAPPQKQGIPWPCQPAGPHKGHGPAPPSAAALPSSPCALSASSKASAPTPTPSMEESSLPPVPSSLATTVSVTLNGTDPFKVAPGLGAGAGRGGPSFTTPASPHLLGHWRGAYA